MGKCKEVLTAVRMMPKLLTAVLIDDFAAS
jgi:hypothetical protein